MKEQFSLRTGPVGIWDQLRKRTEPQHTDMDRLDSRLNSNLQALVDREFQQEPWEERGRAVLAVGSSRLEEEAGSSTLGEGADTHNVAAVIPHSEPLLEVDSRHLAADLREPLRGEAGRRIAVAEAGRHTLALADIV